MPAVQNRWRHLASPNAAMGFIALATGIAGALLAVRYIHARADATDTALRRRYETREVIVAASDLHAGDLLSQSRLASRAMPRDFLPPDAIPAGQAADLMGTHALIDIQRGTPVVRAALQSIPGRQMLSSLLTAGQRALTIPVDHVNSHAGNLAPGDRVDLYISKTEGSAAALVPLLERVEVLATGAVLGQRAGRDAADGNFDTVTLAVVAADAARIVLAQESGSLSVVLRARADDSSNGPVPRSSRELWTNRPRSGIYSPFPQVELLVGGNGGLVPDRSWLARGQSISSNKEDRS